MENKYIWFKQELLEILNNLGYVHFYTKTKVISFGEGRAFYFCPENKTYGYVDIIPYDEIKNIPITEQYLKKRVKVEAV